MMLNSIDRILQNTVGEFRVTTLQTFDIRESFLDEVDPCLRTEGQVD